MVEAVPGSGVVTSLHCLIPTAYRRGLVHGGTQILTTPPCLSNMYTRKIAGASNIYKKTEVARTPKRVGASII